MRIICQCSGGYIFAGSQRLADFVYIFCYTFWRNNRKTYIPYIRTPKKTSENINNLKTLLGFHPYPRSSGDYKNSPSPESLLAEPKQTVKGKYLKNGMLRTLDRLLSASALRSSSDGDLLILQSQHYRIHFYRFLLQKNPLIAKSINTSRHT